MLHDAQLLKLLASALVLTAERESLARRLPYTAQDLTPWSPVTEKHADGPGLTRASALVPMWYFRKRGWLK